MPTLLYPTSAEVTLIAQDVIADLTLNDPLFKFFPIVSKDESFVMWDQEDNYKGLQQLRGYNGQPPRVQATGGKRFVMLPGIYGEYEPIDEQELTTRRSYGTLGGQPINIGDLTGMRERKLMKRRVDRIKSIAWTLFSTGQFSVPAISGQVIHADTFPIQTYSAGTNWSTSANATPLADFTAAQLLHRGHSVNFGAESTAFMNLVTWSRMRTNTNPADIYGRRTQGLGTPNSLNAINEILTGDNLPNVYIYDGGYQDDTNTFVPYLPNNRVVIIGKRDDNSPIGEYQMTRNANNPDYAPGAYTKIIDNGERAVPRTIEVHDGHNGGPAIKFPSAIISMSVGTLGA